MLTLKLKLVPFQIIVSLLKKKVKKTHLLGAHHGESASQPDFSSEYAAQWEEDQARLKEADAIASGMEDDKKEEADKDSEVGRVLRLDRYYRR